MSMLGKTVSWEDRANPLQHGVIVREYAPQPGRYIIGASGMRPAGGDVEVVWEDGHISRLSVSLFEGHRFRVEKRDLVSPSDCAEMLHTAEQRRACRQAEDDQRRAAEADARDKWAAGLQGRRPAWAQAVIMAQLMHDDSDAQTDYFASHPVRSVLLAWSRHTRDLFSEMRKAAATFAETAHLGPGCERWSIRLIHAQSRRYLLHDLDREVYRTQADAEKALATLPPAPADAEYRLDSESVEHREKYSMGEGYYLGAKYSGWRVQKEHIGAGADGLARLFPADTALL